VLYSLTSMGCPAGPLIAGDMERATLEVAGVEDVELELTFDPPWTPDKMSEDAKSSSASAKRLHAPRRSQASARRDF